VHELLSAAVASLQELGCNCRKQALQQLQPLLAVLQLPLVLAGPHKDQ